MSDMIATSPLTFFCSGLLIGFFLAVTSPLVPGFVRALVSLWPLPPYALQMELSCVAHAPLFLNQSGSVPGRNGATFCATFPLAPGSPAYVWSLMSRHESNSRL